MENGRKREAGSVASAHRKAMLRAIKVCRTAIPKFPCHPCKKYHHEVVVISRGGFWGHAEVILDTQSRREVGVLHLRCGGERGKQSCGVIGERWHAERQSFTSESPSFSGLTACAIASPRHRSTAEGFARHERNPQIWFCVVLSTSGGGAQHPHTSPSSASLRAQYPPPA